MAVSSGKNEDGCVHVASCASLFSFFLCASCAHVLRRWWCARVLVLLFCLFTGAVVLSRVSIFVFAFVSVFSVANRITIAIGIAPHR